jgi:hypothetical protein
MQQYNLDLLFTILLISSEQVYFWQDVVHKAIMSMVYHKNLLIRFFPPPTML